ncbi:MAG: hypothetical protein U0270_34255 [Labilithrix sp.]
MKANDLEMETLVLDIPVPGEIYTSPLAIARLPSVAPRSLSLHPRSILASLSAARRRTILTYVRRVSLAALALVCILGTTARAGNAPEHRSKVRHIIELHVDRRPAPVVDSLHPVTVDLAAALVAVEGTRATKHRFARTPSVPAPRRKR